MSDHSAIIEANDAGLTAEFIQRDLEILRRDIKPNGSNFRAPSGAQLNSR